MELSRMAVELARLPGALLWGPAEVAEAALRHYNLPITTQTANMLYVAIRAVLRERGVLR